MIQDAEAVDHWINLPWLWKCYSIMQHTTQVAAELLCGQRWSLGKETAWNYPREFAFQKRNHERRNGVEWLAQDLGHINTKHWLGERKIKEISVSLDSRERRTPYTCHPLETPRNGPFQIHHQTDGRMECPGSPISLGATVNKKAM